MHIGIIGIGAMGAGMARRLLPKHRVVAFDRETSSVCQLAAEGALAADGLDDLVGQLTAPRIVWTQLPAGPPTEQTINSLADLLASDDIVVDGGNSHYRDSKRRAAALAERGIHFLDVGTSGGQRGVELGYAYMIGGDEMVVKRLRPLFEALAFDADKGWGRVGPNGAGHFAKMVHNGVEYGLMRAYAQGLSALESLEEFEIDIEAVTDIWRHGAMARSAILDLTHEALATNPELGSLAPYVADLEPARQTKQEAIDQVAQRGYDRDQFA